MATARGHRTPAVLVVGAGPVGLVLACELARRGVPIRVIDRLTAPTDESRAILVHARSLEMLDRMGVAEAIIASGVRTAAMEMRADGRTLARVGLDSVESRYPFSVTTAQTETERILTERLATLGVRIERGVELAGFTQDEDGVRFTLRHHGGRVEEGSSAWIAGTDGAHSTVRAGMGTALTGSFEGDCFLMGDVDAEHELDPASMYSYFSAGSGPILLFPMVGRRVRVIAKITGERDPDDVSLERLQRVVDERVGGVRLTSSRWITTFEIHHAQVPEYRSGRAFLAGDAAHVHSPAGGQGMNTGMQDAFNLGWKLAFAVAGASDPRLLDSYHGERHPIAAAVIASTTALTTLADLDARYQRVLRNHAIHLAAALAPVQHVMAAQTEETRLSYRRSDIVAGHGKHGRVRPGEAAPDVDGTDLRRVLLEDPTGHVALCFVPAGHDAPAVTVAGVEVRRVLVGTHPAVDGFAAVLDDPDGRVAHRYGADRGGLVLVRPDGYVGYVGGLDDVSGLESYLRIFR